MHTNVREGFGARGKPGWVATDLQSHEALKIALTRCYDVALVKLELQPAYRLPVLRRKDLEALTVAAKAEVFLDFAVRLNVCYSWITQWLHQYLGWEFTVHESRTTGKYKCYLVLGGKTYTNVVEADYIRALTWVINTLTEHIARFPIKSNR